MSELPQVKVQLPRDMGERTWGEELLAIDTPHYIGKVLHMRAGRAGGLQKHVEKDEASYLHSGEAWVYTDTGDGELKRFRWSQGSAIHIPPGSVHKVEAITDCVIFEASTRHFDDRVRLEAQYGRTDTDGLPTTK
jgi:mannose-6-phosphate isomerase